MSIHIKSVKSIWKHRSIVEHITFDFKKMWMESDRKGGRKIRFWRGKLRYQKYTANPLEWGTLCDECQKAYQDYIADKILLS